MPLLNAVPEYRLTVHCIQAVRRARTALGPQLLFIYSGSAYSLVHSGLVQTAQRWKVLRRGLQRRITTLCTMWVLASCSSIAQTPHLRSIRVSSSLHLYRFIYTASSRSVHLGRLISIDSSLSLHLHCFVCTDSYRFIRTNSSLSPLYSQHIWLSCAKFSGTLEGSSGRRRIATTDKTGAGSGWLVSVRFVYLGRSFVWRSLVLKKICSDRFSFVFSTKNFEVCCRNLGSYGWLPFVGYC